jgi:polar amino acid transport system substrate-binding protein
MDNMQPNPKTLPGIVCGMIGLWIFLFYPATSYSQNESTTPRILQVGVIAASPLYMQTPDGRWEGFSAELWQAVAQHLNVPFEFREFSNLEHLVDALAKKEIDVFPSLPVGERLESVVDFSQSYLKSGLSIAVPAEGVESRWVHVFESFFSMNVLKAIGLLVLLSMIAGIIVWSFEKRENSEMFGGDTVGGIGHGIWWAMVTMTTVGYGDKAPKTAGGRIVALIWMFFQLFISQPSPPTSLQR